MGRHALSRPPGAVQRHPPPSHDRWPAERLTGLLGLRLETPAGQYVSPGTGRLALVSSGTEEVVAQQAVRRAATPVLPGSGLKGAVRTLFELLSFSCDPFRGGADRCRPEKCCDACSLFGLQSFQGRVSFADAAPVAPDSVTVVVSKVPIPWLPNASKTAGSFRLYDLREAALFTAGRPTLERQPKELSREVFQGVFETRMSFANLTREELGRLLFCLGLGPDLATRFCLRLGGVKYDGKGAVRVTPGRLKLVGRRRQLLAADLSRDECVRSIEAARSSDWGKSFERTLEELTDVLSRNGSGVPR